MTFAPDREDIAAIVVTRGDVKLDQVCEPLADAGIDVTVWDNSTDPDLAVYGRYAAIKHTEQTVILVVDDDVALTSEAIEGLVAAYEPRKIVANMPPEYRTRYTDSCLVGFGAIFDRHLPQRAFSRFLDGMRYKWNPNDNDGVWHRTCDIVFTTLTPFTLVDLPFEYLPWTRAANRMYKVKGNAEERQRMLDLCRKVRDA